METEEIRARLSNIELKIDGLIRMFLKIYGEDLKEMEKADGKMKKSTKLKEMGE